MKTIKKITAMTILAVVFTISSVIPGFGGAVGSSRYGAYRLYANSYSNFSVAFYGGEIARVIVKGNGFTNLDLYIYDQYGRLVVCDINYSDYCHAEWYPIYTANYTIRIINRGGYYNDYEISTN